MSRIPIFELLPAFAPDATLRWGASLIASSMRDAAYLLGYNVKMGQSVCVIVDASGRGAGGANTLEQGGV